MADRKQQILRAALELVTELGYEACTVELLCQRSGASIGSLYHHFGSKDGVFTRLYLAGIRDYREQARASLMGADSLHALVRELVIGYLRWVSEHPDWARFLLQCRDRVEAAGLLRAELAQVNRQGQLDFAERLDALGYRDQLQPMPMGCRFLILLGPSHELARRWLAGRLEGQPLDYAEVLAEAAWQGLKRIET